jgi:TRAP transporter 4TM/12TM fusion protein
MTKPLAHWIVPVLAVLLCVWTLSEVNYPHFAPQTQLALFAMLGLTLCFLLHPLHPRCQHAAWSRALDVGLCALTVLCCGFIISQTEPLFRAWWLSDQSLGGRAGQETTLDYVVGIIGVVLVLEAARRCIGIALPLLALAFFGYALWGEHLPGWLFPHRGYSLGRIVAQTFLQTQGVFGTALRVMYTYVFLFVLFGALLSATGATGFIIEFVRRVLRRSLGAPAKVAVLSSGLMGSLSGSAVANTATTGTFTIPMMRASGYRPEIAAGIEAAASSGGALVPPVMGAAAYMMLEIVSPPVTYLQIIRAALIPAVLYYLSLFLIVHFYSRNLARQPAPAATPSPSSPPGGPAAPGAADALAPFQGVLFAVALGGLLWFLLIGFTPFRAVTLSLAAVFALSLCRRETRLTPRALLQAITRAGRDVVPLIAAAACVGIIIGVVTLTGVGTRFPAVVLPLAEDSLLLALLLIMISSLVLGMGLPSVVCYLLMATLIGPALAQLGVVPLAAHLFIFYFGMMSMVTPPVALAAYAASSIAGSNIIPTSLAAFRFALVGFTLPFMFVFRPQLLMLTGAGEPAGTGAILYATAVAACGVTAFAAGIAGHLFGPLTPWFRALMFAAAALLLFPAETVWLPGLSIPDHDLAGFALLGVMAILDHRAARKPKAG